MELTQVPMCQKKASFKLWTPKQLDYSRRPTISALGLFTLASINPCCEHYNKQDPFIELKLKQHGLCVIQPGVFTITRFNHCHLILPPIQNRL